MFSSLIAIITHFLFITFVWSLDKPSKFTVNSVNVLMTFYLELTINEKIFF